MAPEGEYLFTQPQWVSMFLLGLGGEYVVAQPRKAYLMERGVLDIPRRGLEVGRHVPER